MADTISVISDTNNCFERRGSLPVPVPIHVVIGGYNKNRHNSESEASGSAFVTPQPRRRRPSQAAVYQHPYRQHRKASAPPELQAHLGSYNNSPIINFPPSTYKSGAIHDPVESNSPTELIINLNNTNKLGVPEGHHSGSDSGVPSEYSSWAPGSSHCNSLSPYEDIRTRSIAGSIEDIPSSASLSDTDEEMMAAQQQHLDHNENPPQITVQQDHLNQPLVLALNGPPPLNRANTESNILNGPSPVPSQGRHRTNSMVFQLNLGNAIGASNTLPNARSVSMFSLNTADNQSTANYPNLSALNIDNQSIYSDAGAPAHFTPGLMRSHLAPSMGSQGSLSGMGWSAMNGNHNVHQNNEEYIESHEVDNSVKHIWLLDTMSKNLSTMYAILLFMIGIVLYCADIIGTEDTAMGEAFNVYLIVVQLMWFVFIHIDIRKYINKISEALEESKENDMKSDDHIKLEPTSDGQYQIRINLPEPRKTFSQHYGFTSGRHAGSLYLKIGAAVFCLGYLIHSGLNLGQKILYLVQDDPAFDSCTCFQDVLMSVLQPIYAFYQLFFIFKYSNLIINRRQKLNRFALMHCISASFLFWAYAIIQETLLAINNKKSKENKYYNINNTMPFYGGTSKSSVLGIEEESEEERDDGYGSKYENSPKGGGLTINYGCNMNIPLTRMINDTTPYLFPFSIEYNILIVGIWIILWENIGRIDRHTHLPSVEMTYEDNNTKQIASNFVIYVDCHSSNRGLFAGLFMTVATVISIILFFIFTSDENTKQHGLLVNGLSEFLLLAIMTITVILAYASIRHLDIAKHPISNVDDIMLYMCLPCIFLYCVFSMVPAITYGKPLFVAIAIAQVVQAVLQTAFICDGLRRCSNSGYLTSKKPGRELITFLVVANVALWLLNTFEIKSEEGNYYKYDYYGKELWTLLSHLTLPLALFYRFHSSVCLVDIWKAGYEPEPEH